MSKRKLKGPCKKVAYSNQKGGPGKTTLSIQTAFHSALKHDKKLKVLVIDFDGQGNTSSRLSRVNGEEVELIGTCTADIFQHEVEGGVKPMVCDNGIHLIYSRKNDVDLNQMEYRADLMLNPAKNIATIEDQYDLIIIDCPPFPGRQMFAALTAASHVVLPVEVSGFAVDGMSGLLNSIFEVQNETNENLELVGVVINKYNARSNSQKDSVAQLRDPEDGLGELIFKNMLRFRTHVDECNSRGEPIWKKNTGSARLAASEFEKVIKEMYKRIGVK